MRVPSDGQGSPERRLLFSSRQSVHRVHQGAPGAPSAARAPEAKGPYSMCYAISTTADPLGAYYRYEFLRPLFPDYPRPAIWPDGYYVPSSTGDEVIEKHACVVERSAMLAGRAAREQCFVINDVNFLNNADLDGTQLPPRGAPNVMMAAGGTQLKKELEDHTILTWKFFTDWTDASKIPFGRADAARSRAVSLPVRRTAHQLRSAARRRAPARRARRQAHGAPRVSAHRRAAVDRRRALGGHGGGRRWRALV